MTRLWAEELLELPGHILELFRVCGRFTLDRDVRPLGSVILVQRQPLFEPRLRVGFDRVNRALRFADPAVNALVRMDHEHVLAFIEAVDGTNFHAIHELALDA